jgi:hypothetical protein
MNFFLLLVCPRKKERKFQPPDVIIAEVVDSKKEISRVVDEIELNLPEMNGRRLDKQHMDYFVNANRFEDLFSLILKEAIRSSRGTATELRKIVRIKSGKGLKKSDRNPEGKYRVYGSNGVVGFHDKYLVENPTIIIGRKGSTGKITLTEGSCWPIDTTYYIVPLIDLDLTYLFYLLLGKNLDRLPARSQKPGIRSSKIYPLSVNFVKDKNEQQETLSYIESMRAKIDKLKELQKKVQTGINEVVSSILDSISKQNTE